MHVALWSYPMLFQRRGGLQVQFSETLAALRRLDLDVSVLDWRNDKLSDFDLVHIFSATHGNHQIVYTAESAGVPAVVSSVLQRPFTAWDRRIAACCERVVGRLTRWRQHTSYRETQTCLAGASHIIALSQAEKRMLIEGYEIDPAWISVVPNGVASRFFTADPSAFVARFSLNRPFVLCLASISPIKNQLSLVRALRRLVVDVVLIGECDLRSRAYLEECLRVGGDRVHYLGAFDHDDPVIASACSAAAVFVLPSKSEVMPLSVLEALAAGTPVVLTKNHSVDIVPQCGAFMEIDPGDEDAITRAVTACLSANVSAETCIALARPYSWEDAAKQIVRVYHSVISAGSGRASSYSTVPG